MSAELVGKIRRNVRLLREELTGRGSSEYTVRYIDLTTGRTEEKTLTEREMYDLYKLQREGKVSIISIHKIVSRLRSHSPQWIDAKFEELREEHVKKWKEKGYSERLIRRALTYANDYSIGIGEALGVSPDVIYPKALDFADQWLEELTKALFV